MAIDDKERIHFRGRGPRGERKARKLNALVDMIQRATPADAGHKNVRIRKTERGAVFTGMLGGVGGASGDPAEIRSFRGTITSISEPPHPSVAEITDAITSAYGSTEPKIGDYVLVTVSNRVPFFARALPQDSSSPSGDFGLHYRNITINGVTQRFLISQTGSFV